MYIIDLNLPNEPHLIIKNHSARITAIEWDPTGQKLLIGDADGKVEIWCRKDYLINQWKPIYNEPFSCFDGETVQFMCWYKNTLNYRINLTKRDLQAPYNEKFSLIKFEPTVKQFGKQGAEGLICISNSGLLWTACFASDGTIITSRHCLGDLQNKIQLIDVNYRLNGNLIIATSNGLVDYPINFYNVSIKQAKSDCIERNQLVINCEKFYSFFPKSVSENKITSKFITHLKFVTKEESNSILIGCASLNGTSTLELWELNERNCQINKRFLNSDQQVVNINNNNSLQQSSKHWIYKSCFNYSHHIVSLTVMNSSIYDFNGSSSNGNNNSTNGQSNINNNHQLENSIQPFIVIAYKDNVIKCCLIKENLQLVCSLNLNTVYRTQSSSKLIDLLHVDDMQFTWSGSGLILIDNAAQLFLYKVPSIIDHRSELIEPKLVVMLLEYSMLNSYDYWDILLTIKPNLIESICDRFTENFKQYQHTAIQQRYQTKYLAIKGSIYRISNTPSIGLNRSGDCYALALLYSIANLIKMILRTTNKNAEKEGPIENLANIIQNNTNEIQLTKIMLILENKDYCVESAILQSLQHLNQWIGDLALYLVGSFPQQCQNNIKFPGGGLIYDIQAINTIRELLVIIQIWGLLNESCLPVFTKLNDNDVIASLYKLLTKSISFLSIEPDEHLLEEYCNLQNNVLIPQLDLTLKARGIISPPLYCPSNDWPLTLHYFKEAKFLAYQSKVVNNVDGAINCNLSGKVDVIRRIGLGSIISNRNANVRICTRCESISLLHTIVKSLASQAWENTWQKQCVCGGHWVLLQKNDEIIR